MKRTQGLLMAIALLGVVGPAEFTRNQRVRCDEKPKKPISIPLDQIYTTCDETSAKYLNYGDGEDGFLPLLNVTASLKSGASSTFLVRGENILSALKAGYRVTGQRTSATYAVHPDSDTMSDKVWFVAYLGTTGSTPPKWIIKSLVVDGKRIRLTYESKHRTIVSADIHAYVVFANLGKVELGTYELELFDAKENEVMLMRKVIVR